MVINYGANKVRFPHPVPVGSRIRSNAVITSVEETKAGGERGGHQHCRDRGRREARPGFGEHPPARLLRYRNPHAG